MAVLQPWCLQMITIKHDLKIKNEWKFYGGRLKAGRNKAKLSQDEVANHLIKMGSKRKTDRKTISFWESLGSERELLATQYRLPHPNEVLLLVELYKINGLWLFLYEREPSLSIEPPQDTHSALYGHHKPRTELEMILLKNLKEVRPEDIAVYMRVSQILSGHYSG